VTKNISKIIFTYIIGIIISFPILSFSEEYTYDDHGQLVKVNYSATTSLEYNYDNIGNRLAETIVYTPLDSDNDGLPDSLEQAGCTDPYDADTDDDAIIDGDEDKNHDGQINSGETDPCSIDTDNDGIQDGTELGYITGTPDTGAAFIPDEDPSTTTDPLKADSDNDGKTDGEEDLNYNGKVDNGESDPNQSNGLLPFLQLLLGE
jgi:YD repeat-containing protein